MLQILILITLLFSGTMSFADGQIPWPWGTEIPFPWQEVEGRWFGKDSKSGREFYFSFETISRIGGHRVLKIKEYDPKSGRFYARGVGFENSRIVNSFMRDTCGFRYRLSVRAYKDKSASGRSIKRIALSIGPIGSFGTWYEHYVLKKVSRLPHKGKKTISCP